MLDADKSIVAPGAQQFSGIHDKGIFEQWRLDPLAAAFVERQGLRIRRPLLPPRLLLRKQEGEEEVFFVLLFERLLAAFLRWLGPGQWLVVPQHGRWFRAWGVPSVHLLGAAAGPVRRRKEQGRVCQLRYRLPG